MSTFPFFGSSSAGTWTAALALTIGALGAVNGYAWYRGQAPEEPASEAPAPDRLRWVPPIIETPSSTDGTLEPDAIPMVDNYRFLGPKAYALGITEPGTYSGLTQTGLIGDNVTGGVAYLACALPTDTPRADGAPALPTCDEVLETVANYRALKKQVDSLAAEVRRVDAASTSSVTPP